MYTTPYKSITCRSVTSGKLTIPINPSRRRKAKQRRGAAAVLGVVLTLALITLTAVAIDFGHIHVAESEMRRSADAAAMAGCWEMFDQRVANNSSGNMEYAAAQQASTAGSWNQIGSEAPEFGVDDVELGNYSPTQGWDSSDPNSFNAVRVVVRRQAGMNGELPLFFGSLTGRETQSLETKATAAMLQTISGFYEPETSSTTVEMMPFALDLPSWLDVLAEATDDDFAYVNGQVQNGSDGQFETNLYPKGTGAPGNRGTVDIGGRNNSTNDIARQIVHGISKQDFIDLGKPLEFDADGELLLNGDTGISAGVKDELASIIGQVRIIPIYTQVNGNGNNAMFTIVRFEGVRILDVKLTGKPTQKRVIIQPANVIARGSKIDYTGQHSSSHLYTPVMLVE